MLIHCLRTTPKLTLTFNVLEGKFKNTFYQQPYKR